MILGPARAAAAQLRWRCGPLALRHGPGGVGPHSGLARLM